ncbi:BspA family leucine-rich repeat surface protein [Enterococcus entomosocium]|uniref:BspA family leucine-rich repeat surface protein n=1 Tax=Enterococcus entomosocium TaxID=3034352 RepID=UPI003BEC8FD8
MNSVKKMTIVISLSVFLFNVTLQPVVAIEKLPTDKNIEETATQSTDESEQKTPEWEDLQEIESLEPSKNAEVPETNESEKEQMTDKKTVLDETNTNKEGELNPTTDIRNATGSWGIVEWLWEEATRTITLSGGTAGSVDSAPWKTHTDVSKIVVEGRVVLPSDSSYLFSELSNLEIIDQAGNFDTSNVAKMTGMFMLTTRLTELDVSNWDTSSVTDMHSMFHQAIRLTELDVSNWDTSNVANMAWAFSWASNLIQLDVSNWDTSNVTYMAWMFSNASNLTELDVSNWDTSNVIHMNGMFELASSLTELDLSNWDTSNVITMSTMFREASSLTKLDVSNWNTSNVALMDSMFQNASSLTELDLSTWDTSNVDRATILFFGATNLSTIHLGIRSRFDHLMPLPTMPAPPSLGNHTGNWVYYLNQSEITPDPYITSSPTDFWREYDGTNPGTYKWQSVGTVTVQYRDTQNHEVAAPLVITGGVRAPFQIEEKAIEGYTIQEVPTNLSGRFTEQEQLLIFRYLKDPVSPVDPLAPENEVDPENPPQIPNDQGSLSIDFASQFTFGQQTISTQMKRYYAQPQRLLSADGTNNNAEERPNYVQISDRRHENERNGWQLAVTQNNQFTNLQEHELKGARLLLTNQQVASVQQMGEPEVNHQDGVPLVPEEKMTLLTAHNDQGLGTWVYRFGDRENAGESIVLEVPPTANPRATSYQTILTWELSAVPGN